MLTKQAIVPMREKAMGVLKRGRQLGFFRRVSKKATKFRRPYVIKQTIDRIGRR